MSIPRANVKDSSLPHKSYKLRCYLRSSTLVYNQQLNISSKEYEGSHLKTRTIAMKTNNVSTKKNKGQ